MSKMRVHNPGVSDNQLAEYLLSRAVKKNPNGNGLPVVVLQKQNPKRQHNVPKKRNSALANPRHHKKAHARRRNPDFPDAKEFLELATDGGMIVLGAFVAQKASEFFWVEQEMGPSGRWVGAAKRLLVGGLALIGLRFISPRFAKNVALGAAGAAVQPLIVPTLEDVLKKVQDQTKPGVKTEGQSGLYEVKNLNIPEYPGTEDGMSGLYNVSDLEIPEYPN